MKTQKGFTLVEAAIAIGVVAILSGIIIPLVMKNIGDAQKARARNDIQVIAGAIASQLKDTGCRPNAAGGPGGASAAGQAVWYSTGQVPEVAGGGVPPFVAGGANTLANLFTAPNNMAATTRAQGNLLFGLGVLPHSAEFGYKGPYLGADMVAKSDPWGNAYLILGYNQFGQANGGPIWVVSAGPSKGVIGANLVVDPNNRYGSQWDHTGISAGNIAVRVQ